MITHLAVAFPIEASVHTRQSKCQNPTEQKTTHRPSCLLGTLANETRAILSVVSLTKRQVIVTSSGMACGPK